MTLIGIGYDVHRFIEGRKLILGGVEIPYPRGLDGHSDADVLCHAIADAVLGAIGERDIGHHFPNTDPKYAGMSSLQILHRAQELVKSVDGHVINVDATVIAEAPRIASHIEAMKINIGRELGLPLRRVGIKGTTNESLGFIGRAEGIAVMAVANVELPE
jgi:2-C-methyl-D-erythritol 2,4-cyclodiphosphate synthase